MLKTLAQQRNKVEHFVYTKILKPFFFKHDPEMVHDRMTTFGKVLGKTAITRAVVGAMFGYSDPKLAQNILGIHFKNPVGLSAGFDKNAELIDIIPSVGFGFMEVGSITGEPCEGNPKPRLWRLPKSKGLVVYYGLRNDGSKAIAARLSKRLASGRRGKGGQFAIPVGTSVAMTNCSANEDIPAAVRDYVKAFTALADIGQYTTINISCPNTSGGQPFVESANLEALLAAIDAAIVTQKNSSKGKNSLKQKPVFVKFSPDMTMEHVDKLIDIIHRHRVDGVICTNLTKKKGNDKILDPLPEHGGVSGKPVESLSNDLISHIYQRELKRELKSERNQGKNTPKDTKRLVVIGTGGIFTAEDAYKKIRLGASLVQMITGMVFEGPQVVSDINIGLSDLLTRDGFTNISEAVGADVWMHGV
jgi:dihydroorotate dehydrogenase